MSFQLKKCRSAGASLHLSAGQGENFKIVSGKDFARKSVAAVRPQHPHPRNPASGKAFGTFGQSD